MAFNPEPSAIRVARQLSRMPKIPTRIGRADGGAIPDDPSQPFSGPILSSVAGRTDHVPMHVPSGAYVIPADVVSAVGEGNSLSGLKVLQTMFSAHPYNAGAQPFSASAGPFGSTMPPEHQGAGLQMPRRADGGRALDKIGKPTPIMAAGGEFVIHPEDVARVGGGDVKHGHKVLDTWVKSVREKHIKTLKKLPGPAK